MKVTNINDKKETFKPYKITIEILVENKEDANLLSKLKNFSSVIFLSDDDGSCISEFNGISGEEATNANDLIQNILSDL